MKKFILMAIVAMFTMSASAQLLTSSRVAHSKSHNTWIELGAGTFTGDVEDSGLGLDLGIRWNKMYTENVGWDILKIGAQADSKSFDETICVKALTGIRGESPVVFGDAKIYANLAAGYLYNIDAEDGAFTWEIGAGLKLTPRFNIGVSYDSYSKNSFTVGLVSLKLGYAL